MPRARRIRTQPSKRYNVGTTQGYRLDLGGWLEGKDTQLQIFCVFPNDRKYILGLLKGQKLYRLAKAIVKQFEEGEG